MPVPTETLHNTKKLNIVFALAAACLAFCTSWLIWEDHYRPWKEHQNDYMDAQAALAELQYLVTQQESFQSKLNEAKEKVAITSKDVDRSQNAPYDELLTHLTDKQAEDYKLNLLFKQKDAWISVARSKYERALALEGAQSELAQTISRKLATDGAELAKTRQDKEIVEDEIKLIKQGIKEVESQYRTAQKQLAELQRIVDEAKSRHERYSSKVNWLVFNMPLADFAAPKATPGRHEIKQVVAYGVKSKLNFLEGYKVDRCNTCHIVIDDKNFSQESLVLQFEQAIPAIQELNERTPVTMPDPPAVYGLSAEQLMGQVAAHWDRVSEEDRKAYFSSLQEQVNTYFADQGMPTIDLQHPLQAHPDLDLFLTTDSPHPMNQMGCTVCHEGNGSETDFMLAAHTPQNHDQELEWTERYYDRNLGVPTMTWSTLAHFWDFPMIPPQYSEASCAKCHSELNDIARFENQTYGGTIRHGRKLFTQVGCINCHRVENIDDMRQVGTDLTNVAAKLSDGFMHNWINNPRDFRPSTWMPHFFMQENNGPDSANDADPDPVLRTKTEVQAMTHYLKTVSKPWAPEQIPAQLQGNAAAGQKLFASVGCLACHANMAEFGEQWIVGDLSHKMLTEDPNADEDEVSDKAQEQFDQMGINAQVNYALKHFTEKRRHDAKRRAQQEDLLASTEKRDPDPLQQYVPPVFTRFAPELSGIGSKVTKEWLYSWLREPRHYSSYTKMPRLRLTEQESLDLAEYLVTFKHDGFDVSPFPRTEETLADLDRRMDDLLSGQNTQATVEKIKADDNSVLTNIVQILLSKHPDRRTQAQRMEYYGGVLSLMDLTDKKMLFVGHKMITHYGCYACHKFDGFDGAPRPGTELTDWGEKSIHQLDFAFFSSAYHHTLAETEAFQTLYPKDRTDLVNWSNAENSELDVVHTHASFARNKLLNPRIWDRDKVKVPYAKLKMPNFYLTEDETESLVTYLLSRRPARVADSLKVDYAGELAGPIAKGRHLINELNCSGCHKIEDNIAALHQYITIAALDDEDDWGDDEEFDDQEGDNQAEEDEVETEVAMANLGEGYGGSFDTINGPPWLRGQGAKVQPGWFHDFLLNVVPLRPWLEVRMPSFNLTGEQAASLVDYFAALSNKESNLLDKQLAPIHKVIADSKDEDAARRAWHLNADSAKTAALLSNYVVENELMNVREFDFTRKKEEAVAEVYHGVLSRAEFFEHLYDVQYPFEPSGFELMDPERYQAGEELFQELKCLSCHNLGDSNVAGANPAPSAPNLALTHRRLRYEWFHQWLQEPGWIQPNTKMPQWFAGGQSAYAAFADDIREPFELAFSPEGETQMSLLMDFIWQAGLTNYTAIDPSRLPGGEDAPAAELPPAAHAMPDVTKQPSTGGLTRTDSVIVLNRKVMDQSSVGPRSAAKVKPSSSSGSIEGQVVWSGDRVPEIHLPVAADFRDTCCPGQNTKPVSRLTLDERTRGVQDCVVYLAGRVDQMPPFLSESPPAVTIKYCQFDHRVVLASVGSTVRFLNSDNMPHNIRGRMGQTLMWSKNLVDQGSAGDFTLDKLGIVQTRSGSGFDWMDNYIWVVDHAGYALTDSSGHFVLDDIPQGEYTLHVWHPGIKPDTAGGGRDTASPTVGFEPPRVVGGHIEVKSGERTQILVQLQ